MKPISFKKKLFPFGDSFGVIIERPILRMLNIKPEEAKGNWVKITIEKLEDKGLVLDKHLEKIAKEKGFSEIRVLAKKEAEVENNKNTIKEDEDEEDKTKK